ncbi:hypothetical protein ACKXGD_16485, partial [Enterococcus lactis]|uniref:hypothetical protein n=1 Tax=Enterococcus lactis TaxID=357441 RepID=UPI0039081290
LAAQTDAFFSAYLNVLKAQVQAAYGNVQFGADPLDYDPAKLTARIVFGTFWLFDAAIEITVPDLTFTYQVGELVPREQVVQPETITVDPPP